MFSLKFWAYFLKQTLGEHCVHPIRNAKKVASGFAERLFAAQARVGGTREEKRIAREWSVANRAWRKHAMEPLLYAPFWSVVLALVFCAVGWALFPFGEIRCMLGFCAFAHGAFALTMKIAAVSFAMAVVCPWECLRRGRRILDATRDLKAERINPLEWARREKSLRATERSLLEGLRIAHAMRAAAATVNRSGETQQKDAASPSSGAHNKSGRRL